MKETNPGQPDAAKELLESAKTPEVIRLERVLNLLAGGDKRVLPRDTGGEIVIEKSDDRYTISASLPPNPKFKSYNVRWTLGLTHAVEDRVHIEGEEYNADSIRGSKPLNDPNDIGSLDDVLDKAEETASLQERAEAQEGEHGQA